MIIKDGPVPIRNTGVIWRVTPKGERLENEPPTNLTAPATETRLPEAVDAPPR